MVQGYKSLNVVEEDAFFHINSFAAVFVREELLDLHSSIQSDRGI